MLADPIWDTLRDNNCFNLIVRQCFTEAEHKGQLKSRVKAIRVPSNSADRILPHVFSHNTEVRHVQFFFHEYGRHVGMVPRSSLKGGKNSLMVEKGTEKPNTKPNKQNTTTQGPQAASSPSCSLSSVQGETCETRVSV